MTNSPDRNRPERDIRQRMRELDWRIQRLEATQMPARYIDDGFDRVDDELDKLRDKSDGIDGIRGDIIRIEGKIDIILKHLTGLGN